MQQDAITAGAHRVPERNGAAIHIQPFRIQRPHRRFPVKMDAAEFIVLPRREAGKYHS